MTKSLIEITFGDALTQARELEECADSVEQLAKNQIPALQGELGTIWQGTAADAYGQKLLHTAQNIQSTAGQLREIASTLRRIAKVFRDSELRALEIATQRTYET